MRGFALPQFFGREMRTSRVAVRQSVRLPML
jgi:hypothetical protein